MGLKFRFDDDGQTYDQALARIKNALGEQFRVEAAIITAGLEERNHSKVASGVCAMCEKYVQLELELEHIKAENKQLEEKMQQYEQKLKACAGKIDAPARRKDLDPEKLYLMYCQTRSLRKTGKQFNCDPKTVKDRLLDAGYHV